MKPNFTIKSILCLALAALPAVLTAQPCAKVSTTDGGVGVSNVKVQQKPEGVGVTMRLNFDSLRIRSNQQFVYTPVLVTADGTRHDLTSVVVNGRNQQIMHERGIGRQYPEGTYIIRRENGEAQRLDYAATVPGAANLSNYSVDVREDLCGCGDSLSSTAHTVRRYATPVATLNEPLETGSKIRSLDKTAYIDFPVNRTELHPDYRRNPAQLDSIINTINALKNDKNLTVKGITIHGYASPEGSYAHNVELAQGRAQTLTDYVRQQVRLPREVFTVNSTPEDWQGLRRYLNESNIDNKDALLTIANDIDLDPDSRDHKMRDEYPEQYKMMLATWYPALRHSDYHITYEVRPFTVEEAKEIFKTNPSLLSQKEMYGVALTYPKGSPEYNHVVETAAVYYPDDETANLNAAAVCLNSNRLGEAKHYLDRAGDSPNVLNAKGVYEAHRGNLAAAAEYFKKAADAGCEQARQNLEGIQ